MIQNLTKHSLANYYQSIIKIVVLNDDVQVSDFQANVEGNVANIQFEVPSGVREIKRLRLYQTSQEESNLLADCTLYVPIASETVFRYKCEVK